jgi:hypothetical protein
MACESPGVLPQSAESTTPGDKPPVRLGPDEALVCFVALAVFAAIWYLWIGRRQWFSFDEWDFIAARNAGHINDLLRPHTHEHWSTIPILAWRGIWQLFGLSYTPYQTLTVLLHVTIAALLRIVMRRAGVSPWISTVAAALFIFFGAGAYNIIYAFQANFDGALVFGLTQLLLADHDGPIDKRDWLGVLAGLCALMCSAPAVTMVAVVGIATLIRRGLKPAAFHTLPLAVVFAAWWLHYARPTTSLGWSLSTSAHFVRAGLQATLGALADIPAGGWLLFAVLASGAIVFFTSGSHDVSRRANVAAPAALLAGAPLFFLVTSFGRANFQPPNSSRYLHIAAAFMLPACGVAVNAIMKRSRAAGLIALTILVASIPGNIGKAVDFAHVASTWQNAKDTILSIGRTPLAHQVPADLRPEPLEAPDVTIGWILRGVASGHIPVVPLRAELVASNQLRLSLLQLDRSVGRPCVPFTAAIVRHLSRGETIGIRNGYVHVRPVVAGHIQMKAAVDFGETFLNPDADHTLVSLADSLTLRIDPGPSIGGHLSIC